MNNLYYNKYLKYKEKYLSLKNQIGGADGGIKTKIHREIIEVPSYIGFILLHNLYESPITLDSLKAEYGVNIVIDTDSVNNIKTKKQILIFGGNQSNVSQVTKILSDEVNKYLKKDNELVGYRYDNSHSTTNIYSPILLSRFDIIFDNQLFQNFFYFKWFEYNVQLPLPYFYYKKKENQNGILSISSIYDRNYELFHISLMPDINSTNDKMHFTVYERNQTDFESNQMTKDPTSKIHYNMHFYSNNRQIEYFMSANIDKKPLKPLVNIYMYEYIKIILTIIEDFYNTYMKEFVTIQFQSEAHENMIIGKMISNISEYIHQSNTTLLQNIFSIFGKDNDIYESDIQYIEYIRNALGIPIERSSSDIIIHIKIMSKLKEIKVMISRLRIKLNRGPQSTISDIIKYIKNSNDNSEGWFMRRIQNINIDVFIKLNENIDEIKNLYGDYNKTTRNIEWFERALDINRPTHALVLDKDQDSSDRTGIILQKLVSMKPLMKEILYEMGVAPENITIMQIINNARNDYGTNTTETGVGWIQNNLIYIRDRIKEFNR